MGLADLIKRMNGINPNDLKQDPLLETAVDAFVKLANGMRGKNPLEIIKMLERQATENDSGLNVTDRDTAIAAFLEEAGMKPAEAREALKTYRANPNISPNDFSIQMADWGKKAGRGLWTSVTTAVGAAATAVSVAATAATLKPGECIELGKDGKPAVVDTNKYAGAVAKPDSGTGFDLVTKEEHAAHLKKLAEDVDAERAKGFYREAKGDDGEYTLVDVTKPPVSVAGSGIAASAPAGQAFTAATAVPVEERPKARIYFDNDSLLAAETDGVPKYALNKNNGEAMKKFLNGEKLDSFETSRLQRVASNVGASSIEELKTMIVKPEPARVVASYDSKLNGIEYQAP